jgi:hypothetical protein
MAHPYHEHREHVVSRARVKHILKAEGGPVPSAEEMGHAKDYIRGMKTLGAGTWSGKDAFQYGAEDAKRVSDRMRPDAPEDEAPKRN